MHKQIQRTTLNINKQLYQQAKKYAIDHNTTVQSVIDKALESLLQTEEHIDQKQKSTISEAKYQTKIKQGWKLMQQEIDQMWQGKTPSTKPVSSEEVDKHTYVE